MDRETGPSRGSHAQNPRRIITAVLAGLLWMTHMAACPSPDAAPPAALVELTACITDIVLDIRYATADNFTGKAVYPSSRCFLSKDAACALNKAQQDLKRQGYRLKVFDGYRPLSVQWAFWKILPDPKYVADPRVGSRHNRGYAVDVSLVRLDGGEAPMPTAYDDFTERARSDFMELSKEALKNRAVLRDAMEKQGFTHFDTEWWHFDYQGWEGKPLLDVPFDKVPAVDKPCDCD